jgi:hypothetical protein
MLLRVDLWAGSELPVVTQTKNSVIEIITPEKYLISCGFRMHPGTVRFAFAPHSLWSKFQNPSGQLIPETYVATGF